MGNTFKMKIYKLTSYILRALSALNYLHLYMRIPVLIAMNKNNAFTIKIQRCEIQLLMQKRKYLAQKNASLFNHVKKLDQIRINRYNSLLLEHLNQHLSKSLPTELICLLYEFSLIKNERVASSELDYKIHCKCLGKMSLRNGSKALLSVSNMNHSWFQRRYELVNVYRNISLFEKGCWLMLYAWFKVQSFIENLRVIVASKFRFSIMRTCRLIERQVELLILFA